MKNSTRDLLNGVWSRFSAPFARGRRDSCACFDGAQTGFASREIFTHALMKFGKTDKGFSRYIATIGIQNFNNVRLAVGYLSMERCVAELGRRTANSDNVISVGRLSPDTLVFLSECPTGTSMRKQIERLQRLLEVEVDVGDGVISAETSIGYQVVDTQEPIEKTLRYAELALDQARENGKAIWEFSEAEYGSAKNRLSLMKEVREGLKNDAFSMQYQPQVNARSGEISGFEALIRWDMPPEGAPNIGDMIELSEKTGDIISITVWTFRRIIQDIEKLESLGLKPTISINVSGVVLSEAEFATHILRKAGKYKDRLVLEVTETALIESPHDAVRNLEMLSEAGFKFSLDDYGTGYSSLEKMRSIPVSELKIDKSFVKDLTTSHHNPLIVRSTIDLAHALELEVVAEGVEDAETMALLAVMGCDIVQGYHISKAMPFDDMVVFLQDETVAERLKSTQSPLALFS